MAHRLDPKQLGLPARSVIEEIDSNCLALVMARKSRIIMADGKKITEKADILRQARPGARIVLKTTAPVCSKTALFLTEHGITIVPEL